MRNAGSAQSSTPWSRTRWPRTRKTANLSTRARLATTHASDWACGRQGEGHSPEHARMTSDHTRLLPKAEGDTCSLPTYNKKCSHTVRSGSSVNRGPDPLTRLAAVVSVRHSPGDSLFRFAKTNSFPQRKALRHRQCWVVNLAPIICLRHRTVACCKACPNGSLERRLQTRRRSLLPVRMSRRGKNRRLLAALCLQHPHR